MNRVQESSSNVHTIFSPTTAPSIAMTQTATKIHTIFDPLTPARPVLERQFLTGPGQQLGRKTPPPVLPVSEDDDFAIANQIAFLAFSGGQEKMKKISEKCQGSSRDELREWGSQFSQIEDDQSRNIGLAILVKSILEPIIRNEESPELRRLHHESCLILEQLFPGQTRKLLNQTGVAIRAERLYTEEVTLYKTASQEERNVVEQWNQRLNKQIAQVLKSIADQKDDLIDEYQTITLSANERIQALAEQIGIASQRNLRQQEIFISELDRDSSEFQQVLDDCKQTMEKLR